MSDVIKTLTAYKDLFEKYNITYLALFGSTARRQANRESDLDLLFDYHRPPSLFQLASLKEELERITHRPVDLVSRRALSKHLKPYILQDLQLIYEKR